MYLFGLDVAVIPVRAVAAVIADKLITVRVAALWLSTDDLGGLAPRDHRLPKAGLLTVGQDPTSLVYPPARLSFYSSL